MRRRLRRRPAVLLAAVLLAASAGAAAAVSADENIVEIASAEQFLELAERPMNGSYLLTEDLDLRGTGFDGIPELNGTLDGGGHTITAEIDREGSAGLILRLNGTVRDLVLDGSVRGTGTTAGIAATAKGSIENCTVRAAVASESSSSVAGFANCDGKQVLDILGCTFAGSVTFEQGFDTAGNYSYFGPFFGYNGGAMGGGQMSGYSEYVYRITLPAEDTERIAKWEVFNTSRQEYRLETRENGAETELIIRVPVRYVTFSDDVSVMSHYGTPVVRWTLTDGSYRYLDGFDKTNASYRSDFGRTSLDGMYRYEDISGLVVHDYEISDGLEGDQGQEDIVNAAGTIGGYLGVSTAAQFESFARLVNSGVPAEFRNEAGEKIAYTSLNILTLGVRLEADIDLTAGDGNGNASEFFGLGKQEFFPYRGSIDGGGHSLTADINAPDGYMIGIISVSSNLADPVKVENLTVKGRICGNTKVGIVGYHDMVADNYADILGYRMGEIFFENVTNEAEISGESGVGGLLGVVSSTEGGVLAHFSSCVNAGTVRVGRANGGGLLGAAGMYRACAAEFADCENTGTVDGANAVCVGGIAGQVAGEGARFDGVKNTGNVTGSAADSVGAVAGSIADAVGNTAAGHSDEVTAAGAAEHKNFGKASIRRQVSFGERTDYTYSGRGIAPETEISLSDCVRTEIRFRGETLLGESYDSEEAPAEPGSYTYSIRTYLEPGDIAYECLAERTDTFDYSIGKASLAFTAEDETIDYTETQSMQAQPPVLEGVEYPFGWKTAYYSGGERVDKIDAYGVYTAVFELEEDPELGNYFSDAETAQKRFEKKFEVRKPVLKVRAKDIEIVYGETPEAEVEIDNGGVTKYTYDIAELGLSDNLAALSIDRAGRFTGRLTCAEEIGHFRVELEPEFEITVRKAQPPALTKEELVLTLENGTLTVTAGGREGIVCRLEGETQFYGNVIRNLEAGRTYVVEVAVEENACYLRSNVLRIVVDTEAGNAPGGFLVPVLIAGGAVLLIAAALIVYEVRRRKRKSGHAEEE